MRWGGGGGGGGEGGVCGGGEENEKWKEGRREERNKTATIKNCSHVDTNIPLVVTLTWPH